MPRAAPEYRYLGTDFRALLWASPRRLVKVQAQGRQRTILTDVTFERREGDAWVPVVPSKHWRNDDTRCDMRLWLFGRHVYLHQEFSKFSHMWTPFYTLFPFSPVRYIRAEDPLGGSGAWGTH